MEFRCFVSYARSDSQTVQRVVQFLKQIFPKVTFVVDTDFIAVGREINQALKELISESMALICFGSDASIASPDVITELKIARENNVHIVPVNLSQSKSEAFSRWLSSIYGVGEMRWNVINIEDANRLDELQALIRTLKERYSAAMVGESVKLIDSVDSLVADVLETARTRLWIFFVDGGTTIRNMFSDPARLEELKRREVDIRFLYVDTNCREFIKNTLAMKKSRVPSPSTCKAVYEGLLQASMAIHNNGPHERDVVHSKAFLREIVAKGLKLSIRKTSQLPLQRMIVTDGFVYRTHFALLEGGYARPVLGYYSLRFDRSSGVYEFSESYYEHLFQQAFPDSDSQQGVQIP